MINFVNNSFDGHLVISVTQCKVYKVGQFIIGKVDDFHAIAFYTVIIENILWDMAVD